MFRRSLAFLVLAAASAAVSLAADPPPAAPPQGPEPLLYELMINGETFLVEAQHAVKFKSRRPGGPTYDVALRVAPMQRVRLPSLQFDYDLPAAVQRRATSAKVRHELGFTLLVNDLGPKSSAPEREQALTGLVESARSTFQELSAGAVTVSPPHQRKFALATAAGVTLRYNDRQNLGHTSLVYVFYGEGFSGSCLVQYLDRDEADILPLVKKTLDSLRATD